MTTKDVEQYVKVLRLSPDAKYILVVSRDSGINKEDLARIKLSDSFLDEIFMIKGNVNDMIEAIPTTKK